MPTHRSPRDAGRSALDVFIGEWTEQVLRPDIPPGRVSFEWALEGQFLIQRSEIPQPEFPDSIALVAYDGDAETYTQHYFDSRGVARIYKMGLRDGVWTLLRDEPTSPRWSSCSASRARSPTTATASTHDGKPLVTGGPPGNSTSP